MRVQWRGCGLARRWWWAGVAALAVAAWATLSSRPPHEVRTRALFTGTAPHAVAHLAADWSTQPVVGRWIVEGERSNYTSWQYAVRFECGDRCSGSGLVDAHEEAPAPDHGLGHATKHRVHVVRRECSHLPLFAWPHFCDETESLLVVTGEGGDASVSLVARAFCSTWHSIRGACAGALHERSRLHLQAIGAAFSQTPYGMQRS